VVWTEQGFLGWSHGGCGLRMAGTRLVLVGDVRAHGKNSALASGASLDRKTATDVEAFCLAEHLIGRR